MFEHGSGGELFNVGKINFLCAFSVSKTYEKNKEEFQ